jgi:hypothetical protein
MRCWTGVAGASLLWWVLGCGGASVGENQAGGDGWLDHSSPPTQEPPELADDGAPGLATPSCP